MEEVLTERGGALDRRKWPVNVKGLSQNLILAFTLFHKMQRKGLGIHHDGERGIRQSSFDEKVASFNPCEAVGGRCNILTASRVKKK